MIGTNLYILDINNPDNFIKVDLFKDENFELNSSVQNINDISKTFSDFSQSFTVPASDTNNRIFQHYYNSDVDGSFNPNIRVSSLIEIGSLPFRFGLIQLEDVKLKNAQPSSYTIRFFSKVVNLSDSFGDDELTVLDLSEFDHEFTRSIVFDATQDESINNGDIYYPLISSIRNFQIGTGNTDDITNVLGEIKYTDLKPALRVIRIIEAIENKYNILFDREFLNRAAFGNLFMWLHSYSGEIKVLSTALSIDYTSLTIITEDWSVPSPEINITTNSVAVDWENNFSDLNIRPSSKTADIKIKIITTSPYPYILEVFDNGVLYNTYNNLFQTTTTRIFNNQQNNDSSNHLFTFKVSSIGGNLTFTSELRYTGLIVFYPPNYPPDTFSTRFLKAISASQTTANSILKISEQIPKLKVRDFITSIIKMFNLVLTPISNNKFSFIPLDDWYSKGKLVDITKYIDTKDITIKKPKLFKRIDFKHQKSGQILNEQFRENNGLDLGYGDLATTYDIDGGELKVETQFDNLMFERLTDRSTDDITNVQVGKSIDKTLQPYIGKPYLFYRAGYQFYDLPIKADEHSDLDYTWFTSTENDSNFEQVTQSVNFSADVSTFLYSEITNNLFSNYWQDYISDLYSTKRRLGNYRAQLPIGKIIDIKLNDRIQISDRAYIINSMRSNLTTGEVNYELLNYIGAPYKSINSIIPITVDTIEYSVDTTDISADATYYYLPQYSPFENRIQYTELFATSGAQDYDLKITANSPYVVTKVDTGDGVGWVDLENTFGNTSAYLLIKVSEYTSAITNPLLERSMELDVVIGLDTFTLTITQSQ
jgi:hypothetical protein